VTFLLTVFADLVVAVNVGVILAVLHFLRRMAESVETVQLDDHALRAELQDLGLARLPAGLLVYDISGPMFFGAIENFERAMLQTHAQVRVLIVRLRHVPFTDITGLQTLEEVIGKLHKRKVKVLVCEANERVAAKLRNAGIVALLDEANCVPAFHDALASALAA